MKIEASAISDKGPFREKNEDSFCLDLDLGLLAVADGIGGSAAGEVASRMAIEVLKDFIVRWEGGEAQGGNEDEENRSRETLALAEGVRFANRAIHDTGERTPHHRGMGTTLTAALIRGERLSIAHVGDSRAYLIRAGCIEQMTDDHSLVAEQLRMGMITEEEARYSTIRNVITRSLGGGPELEVDVSEMTLSDGDKILLCSDGITSVVSDEAILEEVNRSRQAEDLCKRLVGRATEGGSRDNMTVVTAFLYKDGLSFLRHKITALFGR